MAFTTQQRPGLPLPLADYSASLCLPCGVDIPQQDGGILC